jgi:hypothetical protein
MAFEKIRLALFLLGKLLFSQATEMFNPSYSNGLPPNLAATDPSINYHSKVTIGQQRYQMLTDHLLHRAWRSQWQAM